MMRRDSSVGRRPNLRGGRLKKRRDSHYEERGVQNIAEGTQIFYDSSEPHLNRVGIVMLKNEIFGNKIKRRPLLGKDK